MAGSRSERLLALLQALRRHRRPVAGSDLAEETGISLRTLYRDIASLRAQGAVIEGEAGVGYILKPGFMLPPMMFSPEEIEALVLGSRWVANSADPRLAEAARNALTKVAAVLPDALREELDGSTLIVAPRDIVPDTADISMLRAAIRSEKILRLSYTNEGGTLSKRTVWPFALAYFEQVRVLAAWCEMRADFRHFRTDRISAIEPLEKRYPKRRPALLKEWRLQQSIHWAL